MRWLALPAAVLVLASPALGADRTVGTVTGLPSDLTAWGGHAVFAAFDFTTSAWTLMHATESGVSALGVPAFGAPPQADVGPDAAGRPVVVYRRCSGDQVTGCHVYELALDVPGAREKLVAALYAAKADDDAPTIWKGRIAFGRRHGGRVDTIYVQRAPGSRRLRRLARGTVPACSPRPCSVDAEPEAMDLGANGLAVVWNLAGGDAIPQEGREVWRMPLDGSPGRLLDAGVAAECGFGPRYSFTGFGAPTVVGSRVGYLRTRGDCFVAASALALAGPSPRTRSVHRVGGAQLAFAAAPDAGRWWSIRGPAPRDSEAAAQLCRTGDCSLVLSDAVRFQHVRIRVLPTPPLMPRSPGTSGGPRTPAALFRYLRAHYAIFRARARPVDALPALARRQLGRSPGARFLARLAGYDAYAVPHDGGGLCLVLLAATFSTNDCEQAVDVVDHANVFPIITLPNRRLLFMALLPDGATGVVVSNPEGYRRRLHPYRNTVARILPGIQGSHAWTLRWTRRGKRHVAPFG